MKSFGKVLTALLVMLALVLMIPNAGAAPISYQVESGKTANLSMTFTNVQGLQIDKIQVSNSAMVVSKSYDDSQLGMIKMAGNGDQAMWMNTGGDVAKAVLVLKTTVKGKVGDTCNVTVFYTVTFNQGLDTKTGSCTFAITIKAPTLMDTTELNNQITVAEGLEKDKYTTASWQALEQALKAAQEARSSKKQATIDQAAQNLKAAITALVKMDYSALTSAMDAAQQLQSSEAAGPVWTELGMALQAATDLAGSGDQAAVDAAAQRLQQAILQVQRYLENNPVTPTQPNPTTPEATKPTEPEDTQCNEPSHKLWPVLFWVSLLLNIAMAVLIVVYVITKKRNRKDTTPLVEYHIEDDE
ncbi:MAG: hypothetical protein E7454_06605 [Ruminococcaceae bacterium]|nr:hypothetical protein [Oscillospiraceae bacterium]